MVSKPGELVVDPFTGSGTTGVACMATGRRFLGADVDPGAVALAIERLDGTLIAMSERSRSEGGSRS
jgi:site-specific DNA-methyltransferase (adenine-specific)